MSNVNFNPVKVTQSGVASAPGQVSKEGLSQLVSSLPIADKVAVGGGEDTATPAIFEKLSSRDKQTLMELPAAVRNKVLAEGTSSDLDAAKLQISQALLGMTKKLVSGEGIAFEPEGAFRVSDAAIAYDVISNMSVADRKRLEGVNFKRVQSTFIEHEHLNREVDGAAHVGVSEGKGFFGQFGFKLANLFEMWALTAPLGLMLRSWFPHALAEYRNREVHIGDAQASRMKEVLVHEIGHQVQFGQDLEMNQFAEWAKLSGWQNADGSPAVGLTGAGQLTGFNPDVRPTRTNNFVYEDFTKDLTPEAVKTAADAIKDPELKAEFLQTAKIKKNLMGAIKETFGVEAKGYSMTNPLEDFAESYRAFQMDPELLVRKAPDKFLYLNANSAKYTPEQIQVFFERAGKDPKATATSLLTNSGLNQTTIEKVFKANGLAGNTEALAHSAEKALAKGAELPAFRQAFMEIQKRVSDRDLTFVNAFTKDPSKALGAVWSGLSEAERFQFADEAGRVEIVQKMQKGLMSYATGATQGLAAMESAAVQELGNKLMSESFLNQVQDDPAKALATLEHQAHLPPAVQALLETEKGRESFKRFASKLGTMVNADNMWIVGGGDLKKKVSEGLKSWDGQTLTLATRLLEENPEDAAKYFGGVKIAGDGTVPPGGN